MARGAQNLRLIRLRHTQNMLEGLGTQEKPEAESLQKAAGAEDQAFSSDSTPQTNYFALHDLRKDTQEGNLRLMRERLEDMIDVLEAHDKAQGTPSMLRYEMNRFLNKLNLKVPVSLTEFETLAQRFNQEERFHAALQDEINNETLKDELEKRRQDLADEDENEDEKPDNITDFKRPNESSPSEHPGKEQQGSEGQQTPSRHQTEPRIIHTPSNPLLQKRFSEMTPEEKAAYQKHKQDLKQYKEENKDERKKRAEELWKRRKLGLGRPSAARAGWNPLADWLAKKIAESRLAKAIARNFIDPVKQAITNSRAWQAIAPRIQPLIDAYNKVAAPFRAVNNALNSAGQWLSDKTGVTWANNLLNSFGNAITNALRGWAGQGIRALGNQLGNLLSAARAYSGHALGLGTAVGGLKAAGVTLAGIGGAVLALLTSAAFWWVIAIVALFAFVFWNTNQLSNSQCDKPGEMKVVKRLANARSTQDNVPNGTPIEFYIEAQYIWSCNQVSVPSMTVTDKIPEGLEYVDNTAELHIASSGQGPNGTYDSATRTLTWTVTNIKSNDLVGFYFIAEPTKKPDGSWSVQDTWVMNQADITYTEPPPTSLIQSGGGYPPTKDNCGGKYPLNNPIGNFGDPRCDFDKDKLYTMLSRLDPQNASYWFTDVIRKESSYSPNAHNPASTSGRGAYGLFQMNPDNGTATYDRGDVDWQTQVSNAINYNNMLAQGGRAWCYWAAAMDRWTPRCRQR